MRFSGRRRAQGWLTQALGPDHGLALTQLTTDSVPADRPYGGDGDGDGDGDRGRAAQAVDFLEFPLAWEEIIKVCERAFERDVGQKATEMDEADACLVVHNLFAWEFFHVAEALAIPSVAISPCLIAYGPPAGLKSLIKEKHPALARLLDGSRVHSISARSLSSQSKTKERDRMGWADIEHWLWPLYSQRFALWRQERLGLSPVPYVWEAEEAMQAPHDEATVVVPPKLLYGISPTVLPRPGAPCLALPCLVGDWKLTCNAVIAKLPTPAEAELSC